MPEPGGLRLEEAEHLLVRVAARSRVAGAGLSGLLSDPRNAPPLERLCAALGL